MKHYPFPDIGQFRNVIRNVSNHARTWFFKNENNF